MMINKYGKNFLTAAVLTGCLIPSAHSEVRESLYHSGQSYQNFLSLGQAYCLDTLIQQTKLYQRKNRKETLFSRHFGTLAVLHSPLVTQYYERDFKKTFAAYQRERVGMMVKRYREREEYFNINRSPLLICSKLFSENTETKKLYRDFLFYPGHLIPAPSNVPDWHQKKEKTIETWTDNP